ncbi:nucleotide-diphospho-sugar transferases superfamily protein [Actinidia rufa]|uniref:Nucleotide-diphospho-sugar transferases superfamily protein n=1 Tax=Actinidia rufa TaxID=165716 RepID=A0A7J0E3I5_9ERIC|nr:nucleotide-diphospho-sugar transferases superfamily protein [Actinidia rufa]
MSLTYWLIVSCRWIIDPPLEVTVPAKRTPWPDAPPELPSTEKITIIEEKREKHATKTRSHRSKRSSRSKKKHETRLVNAKDSTRHPGEK